MDIDWLLMTCVGFEDNGEHVRFYLDGPTPVPSVTRDRPVRTALFHMTCGADAERFREYLARHRCWAVMRVPQPYTPERGAVAVEVARRWHAGPHSPLYLFAADRRIRDEEHRGQLRRVVAHLIASVLENPVNDRDDPDLDLLRQVVETAPVGTDLGTVNDQ